MPIYEYQCQECGCEFEVKQGFDAPLEAKCPQCAEKADRVMSTFSFGFSDSPKQRQSQAIAGARRVQV